MIGYNNQSIKLLPNKNLHRHMTKNMHNTKPSEVDCAKPTYLMWHGLFLVHMVFSNEKV